MDKKSSIAVLGTYDTKGKEHLFLKERVEKQGFRALTVNVGTKKSPSCDVDLDLFTSLHDRGVLSKGRDRDQMIQAMLQEAKDAIKTLYGKGKICGIVSAGGGSGTHLCTGIMQVLPLGVPKVMLSTVASRDMSSVVGTRDITMMHSVSDILGINSILGGMLDKAAAAVCAMAQSDWTLGKNLRRIALSFFGFITQAAEQVRSELEDKGYEVVTFHANGTGGTAMEELAQEGYFDGILDLATHELADHLMKGYCGNIGPHRFLPVPGKSLPRLVVPGGLDCAVLEFDRHNVPEQYRDRKIFFYDFRSAIRLNEVETKTIARQLSTRLNPAGELVKVLIPMQGWSVADHIDG
ncbi:MAG: hypothetical protein GY797_02985, partial [Deltaproteobacteria bacterium]|nr:hypothetical protein [Deltaproteobacteria bacterium]